MKQNFPRWLTPEVWRAVVIAVPTLLNTGPVAAEELKYWVSEHFSEKPNIFETSTEELENAPKVLDLSEFNWSYKDDGDVRLCFDNRSLLSTWRGSATSNSNWKNHCRSFQSRLNYKVNQPDPDYIKKVTQGLLVYTSEDGTPTCEATFTIASLYSVLTSLLEGENLSNNENLLVFPFFRADGDPFYGYPAIKAYLQPGDSILRRKNSDGRGEIKIRKSMECLSPAYEKYWKKVIDYCTKSLNEEINEVQYFDILTETSDDFLEIANKCK